MAISRPFLLAVLGAVLLGATVLAVQNARDTTNNEAAPAAISADPAPTAPAPSNAAPAETLKSAFDLSDVDTGRFSIALSFKRADAGARVGLRGAFDRSGNGAPHIAVSTRLGAAGKQSLVGEFVSLGDKAYFVRGDTGWRVPGQVWTPEAQKQLQLDVHPATWVRDVKSEGTEQVRGVETEHLSATLDPQAMLNDLGGVTGSAAPRVSKAEAARVKGGSVDVWVGKDDHVVRRMDAELVLPARARFGLEVRLSDINKPQRIKAPAHVRTGVPSGTLGVFAESMVGRINGATGAHTPSLAALTSPNPGRAARAVRRHKKVVILFRNDRGLDDRAMASVIRSVDKRTQAVVLSDPVDAVDRYGKLVQDLGVNETPSVVIIDSTGKAKLIEGYVDSDTLAQAVADAR
jgi:hypothetical protein